MAPSAMLLSDCLKDPTLVKDKNFINGEWLQSYSARSFGVYNPSSNDLIGSCPESTVEDVRDATICAARAQVAWKVKSGRERSRILRSWYNLILENRDDLAMIICMENGKARQDATGEVLMAAGFVEWFAEEAVRIYGDVIPHSNSTFSISVLKEPVGVCGLITPWNFPSAMITRKLAACLAAGCTAIVKPDALTPFSASAIAVLAQRAGLPPGTFNIVHAQHNTAAVGLEMCKNPMIRKLSFTGSTRVGKILMSQSASNIQKLSLELGGNAPFIVFDDADLDVAISSLIACKFKVSGQTCVSANRIYVQSGIHDAFVRRLVDAVKAFKVGPSSDLANTHGPLINPAGVEKSNRHVQDAISKGARVMVGYSKANALDGNFFQPTVLVNANHTMLLAHEETFGPVAAIFRFDGEDEVISHANDVDVGLASYVMTRSHDRARAVSEALHVGMVAINTGVISDPAAPFGGVKLSGLGRESSKYGIEEYLQMKTILTGHTRSLL